MRRPLVILTLGVLVSGGVGTASATPDKPTLVDVDVLHRSPAPPAPSGANCSNNGPATGTYALTGWVVGASQTAHLNTATIPSGLGVTATSSAMAAGFNAWTGVPRITVANDGTITKPTANRSYDLMFGRTSGNSLAVTYTWRWSDGFVESDTIFNNAVPWFHASSEGDGCYETIAKYDVQNIAAHEFGHTYGLDHPSGARFETMYAYGFTGETLKRSPAAGDVAGINAAY